MAVQLMPGMMTLTRKRERKLERRPSSGDSHFWICTVLVFCKFPLGQHLSLTSDISSKTCRRYDDCTGDDGHKLTGRGQPGKKKSRAQRYDMCV